jgi:hypothetical protein
VSAAFIRELQQALPTDGFKSHYLREELLSKYCDPKTTPADIRRTAAVTKWLLSEANNARTNQRLQLADANFGWLTYEQLCSKVKTLIARILGPVCYPEVILDSGVFHTNGASTRVKRSSQAALLKLQGEVHLSNSAIKHWLVFASGTRLSKQVCTLREENVLFTVPKKSDIDRVACKEPEVNMLLQRAVGNHIRHQLMKFGINLNDQTRNQELARCAVQKGLATIDLSSASDSITRQLVFDMLPFEWWSLLDDLRVKTTKIPAEFLAQSDQVVRILKTDPSGPLRDLNLPEPKDKHIYHELEMFSSMGNGFTFELESLLFYAITRIVCRRSGVRGTISVYGDDIIAPIGIVPRLKRIFDYIGFTVNMKKSFWRGPFRESCGKHYHNGFDVTPFYIRREILSLMDLILHLNHVLEWDGRGWGFFTSDSLAAFHKKWSRYVPARLHGGIDPSDPGALVTGDLPRHRLVPVTKPWQHNRLSAELHWFMMKESTDIPIGVDPRFEVGYKTQPFISCGEQSTWRPYLITEVG